MQTVHSASIDPPEPIIDGWCPLHGWRDPDAEYEASRERDRLGELIDTYKDDDT
jgi:hypothetical protein